MSNKLKIKIQEKEKKIDNIYKSIIPEQNEIEGRSKVKIYKNKEDKDGKYNISSICIEISSPDLVSLRASLNTWFKLYKTAESVSNL